MKFFTPISTFIVPFVLTVTLLWTATLQPMRHLQVVNTYLFIIAGSSLGFVALGAFGVLTTSYNIWRDPFWKPLSVFFLQGIGLILCGMMKSGVVGVALMFGTISLGYFAWEMRISFRPPIR